MKKKWIVCAVVAVLVLVAVITVVVLLVNRPSRDRDDKDQDQIESVSFQDDCWNHVSDCKINELEDGTVMVTLTAPDYGRLVELMAEEGVESITEESVAQAVKDNPKAVKIYSFAAPSDDEADVKAALMEQISYELVAITLENVGE